MFSQLNVLLRDLRIWFLLFRDFSNCTGLRTTSLCRDIATFACMYKTWLTLRTDQLLCLGAMWVAYKPGELISAPSGAAMVYDIIDQMFSLYAEFHTHSYCSRNTANSLCRNICMQNNPQQSHCILLWQLGFFGHIKWDNMYVRLLLCVLEYLSVSSCCDTSAFFRAEIAWNIAKNSSEQRSAISTHICPYIVLK